MVDATKLPNAGVGGELLGVVAQDGFDVRTAHFFFAFDKEFDVAGQFAVTGKDRVNGEQTMGQVAFVVADPAGVQMPIA